jgi:1-deoxy-D-xylulose-5-phosphate reductoisomerase
MKTPIAYALGWPDRIATPVQRLDLAKLGRLDFAPIDEVRFPAVSVARTALKCGPAATTVLNCANETVVSAFISGQCGFLDISSTVNGVLSRFLDGNMANLTCQSLEEIAWLDKLGRAMAIEALEDARQGAGG